jgi:hypothetical protein
MPTRRRAIVRVDSATTTNDPNAPQTLTPVTTTQFKVDWTMAATDLTSVRAFNVVLTVANGNPRNTGDVVKSRTVWDPAARTYTFADMQAGIYTAWVQTVVDGADSDWVSSTDVTVTDDLVPTFRSSDDRNAAALVEDFRSASLPTGISLTNGTYDLTTTRGEMAMVQGGGGFALSLLWYPNAWANAQSPPVDNVRDSASIGNLGARLMIKLKVDTPSSYFPSNPVNVAFYGGVPGFGVEVVNIPVVNDGKYHIYYVPVGRITFSNTPYMQLNIPVTIGSSVRIDAVAIAWGSFDSSLDENVDHGITARNQFGKATGGDYFLQSTIRQASDPSGSQIIIDSNGVFFRSADGTLQETAYKQGRRCDIGNVLNLGSNNWGSNNFSGITGGKIFPALPTPVATNKIRMIMEPKGAIVNDTGSQPQRLYVEPFDIGTTGWTFAAAMFFGGSLSRYTVNGPWSQSNQAKSHLTLSANHGFTPGSGYITETADGWYYGADDMPSQVSSTYYYRMCTWIAVQMPTATKSNGRPYFADLTFYLMYGTMTQNSTDVTIYNAFETRAHVMRAYSDGRTYLFPMWYTGVAALVSQPGGSTIFLTRYEAQNIKVDWTGLNVETGAGTSANPVSVDIDHIDFDYITGATSSALSGLTYTLTFLEEY